MKTKIALLLLLAANVAGAQQRVQPDALRRDLFIIAHDSMGGRDTGSRGNYLSAEWVAAQFKKFGLEPAGENGSWFQTIPFKHVHPDTAVVLTVGAHRFTLGNDVLPFGPPMEWRADGVGVVFGGVVNDSSTWISAEKAAGQLVVFGAPPNANPRALLGMLRTATNNARFAGAVAWALTGLESLALDLRAQRLQGSFTTNLPATTNARPVLLVSSAAAREMIDHTLSGGVRIKADTLDWPARNVVAVLRGSDPARHNTYVSLTAHNDHVGYAFAAADHDSVYAYNRVIRGLGADTPDRTPTPEEWTRINAVRDSLRKAHPARRDSIFNGADDDGTGTVALVEVARLLASGKRPARSIIITSHAAEERGLLGSRWIMDHPTVPRDSIISEMDMDMIGRGNVTDLPDGGPGYLEVVGAKRLSKEYGELFETINARQPQPFSFNYTYDQPGHPLQYYCRADHYSYARYGIPAFAVSRGEHADYHQITDEPQYIDYNALSRVANLALDFVRTVANLDHRPVLDQPKQDPNAPCRQ